MSDYSTDLTSGLPIALGGNTFGWTSTPEESFAVLDAFTAAGGHHVDTADAYSQWVEGHSGGESETILGDWFAQTGKRRDVFLATKVGARTSRKGLERNTVRTAVQESLERLQTDYIDLYYAHYDDESQSPEQLAETFGELVADGTVRYIGLSNLVPERQQAWIDAAKAEGFAVPAAQQPSYSLARRGYVEGAYGEVARTNGLAIFSYSSLASGMLTGKYRSAADTQGTARGFAIAERMGRDAGVRALALEHEARRLAVALHHHVDETAARDRALGDHHEV